MVFPTPWRPFLPDVSYVVFAWTSLYCAPPQITTLHSFRGSISHYSAIVHAGGGLPRERVRFDPHEELLYGQVDPERL